MALTDKSLFLYGLEVTPQNSSIDFVRVLSGPTLLATLNIGFYSLEDLAAEIKRAMEDVDAINTYTVSVDRTISGGTQNRVTISTSGTYLSLLFASGPRAASSTASLIGFNATDRTGSTSYTGVRSSGIVLIPEFIGYNFVSPEEFRTNFGQLNISASGKKEAIVFSTQYFWEVQFKYISKSVANNDWASLLTWMIAQKPIEFIPEISDPSVFYSGTLEKTVGDGRGLGYKLKEMLPDFPQTYDTGVMGFRVTPT